jgi:hypothetical protein
MLNTGTNRGRGRLAPLACAAALVAVALAGGALAATPPAIESLRGAVEVGAGEPMRWRAARAGEALTAGDSVRTGADGRAEIRLRTGLVRLYENSLLSLPADSPARAASERVRMERGSSLFDVLRRSDADRFEVETPEVAVMVKGTRFSIALLRRGASVAVWRGSVSVRALAAALDRELLVRPGFAAIGGAGSPFELVLNPADDPWDGWQGDLPLPLLPQASLQDDANEKLAALREAVRAELEAALEGKPGLARELVGRTEEAEAERGAEREAVPAALASKVDAAVDRMADGSEEKLTKEMQARVAETAVGGGSASGTFDVQIVTSGGPNYAVITGPGLNTTVSKNDVEQILDTGDPSRLAPTLLNQLNQNGVDPISFVQQLDTLL